MSKANKKNSEADKEVTVNEEAINEANSSQQEVVNEGVSEIEKLEAEKQELNDKLLRQMAEFDNFKKRTAKEKLELAGYARAECLKEILGVIDNFERALQYECGDSEFKKGIDMIFHQLEESLKAQGLEEIEALNVEFNPEVHNAINQVEDEAFGDNTVCNVLQKGYKLGDRVIRHAMVVVANP